MYGVFSRNSVCNSARDILYLYAIIMATQIRKNILTNKWEVQEKKDGRWIFVAAFKTEAEAKAYTEPKQAKTKKVRKARK